MKTINVMEFRNNTRQILNEVRNGEAVRIQRYDEVYELRSVNPLQAYDHKPIDINKATEPYVELFKSEPEIVQAYPTSEQRERKQAEHGYRKPIPKKGTK